VVLGLAVYAGFVMNWHYRLFGVSPFG
jgi:hypothetical protein